MKKQQQEWNSEKLAQRFALCKEFILRSEPLDEPVRQVFVNICCGPVQDTLYDAILLPVPDDAPDEAYIEAGAEAYYWQWQLNKKLGRNVYGLRAKDDFLLTCILGEMQGRKGEWKKRCLGVRPTVERKEAVKEQIYQAFLRAYPRLINDRTGAKALARAVKDRFEGRSTIAREELEEYLNRCTGQQKAQDASQETAATFFEHFKHCMKKNGWVKSENELNTNLGRSPAKSLRVKAAGGNNVVDKNRLYYSCLGIGADFRQFSQLRELLKSESPQPQELDDDDNSLRDATIQAVFYNINQWAESVLKTEGRLKSDVPCYVVEDVNEMLRKNGFRDLYGKAPGDATGRNPAPDA